jgi:hypothetical protein
MHQPLDGLYAPGQVSNYGERRFRCTNTQLATTWALSTSATYDNTIQRYFGFCEDQQLALLAANPAKMARLVIWLRNLSTTRLQVYNRISRLQVLQGPWPRPSRVG